MILWSCTDPHLLSKTAIKTGEFRNTDNAAQSQKDTYHLALLTLNLGNVNRKLCIGGNVTFPSWIRNDPDCVVLPYLVLRNGAHVVALCEANDPVGGIARNQHLARDTAMLAMVVPAELTAPSVAIFIRGTHEVGSFIELLETEQKTKKENNFWILHACIFRLAFGKVTSGEMVDPSSSSSDIRTSLPADNDPNLSNEIIRRIRLHSQAPEMTKIGTSRKFKVRSQSNHVNCLSQYPAQKTMMSADSA